MKWLLITTSPRLNPGDQFIRVGVERLVRTVDPRGEFDYLAKDVEEDLLRPRPFDRAVLCGMPLWWNNRVSVSQNVGWWGTIMGGWPSAEKRRFLILGAGPANGNEMRDAESYIDAIKWSIGRSWAVTTRSPVVDWPYSLTSICPAAFAVDASRRGGPSRFPKLMNLMQHGAHDDHFDRIEAAEWRRRLPEVAAWGIRDGFAAIAHDDAERELAEGLGFETVLRPESIDEYLEIYATARIYVGNRLHGAMATAAAGGKAAAIGYDSRIRMLDRFNVLELAPSEASNYVLDEFLAAPHAPDFVLRTIAIERRRLLELLGRFAAGE